MANPGPINMGAKKDPVAQKIVGDYTLTSTVLGKGQYGEVVLARSKFADDDKKQENADKTNQAGNPQKPIVEWLACKIIKKANLNPLLQQNLKREISILSRIRSPYVIGFYDIQKTMNNFYLFMQYCNGGDLDDLRQLRGRFAEQEARYFLSQIIKGFKAIHELKVLHRDVKLANILVHFKNLSQDKVLAGGLSLKEYKRTTPLIGHVDVAIADLGFAKQLQQEQDLTQTMCGTPLFMAPEILLGKKYTHKVDVWSLGAVFYEMLTGFTPFTGRNKEDLKRNLEHGDYRFPKHIKMSLEGLDFLNCCLQYNPDDRLSWDDLMKHSYLNYDFTEFMVNDKGQQLKQANNGNDPNELLLSYNEQSGMYSALMADQPHAQLNEKNAILMNTKDPIYFQQTYEKTILKKYQDEKNEHVEEQMKNIEKLDQELGQSMLMDRWENDKDVIEPMKEFFDPEPMVGDKVEGPKPINNLAPSTDSFKIDAGDNQFLQDKSSQLDGDQDKTFPYLEMDKDDGTGKLHANDERNTIENFADPLPSRPQSLALNDGTPTGPTNFQQASQNQHDQFDYQKIQEAALQIRQKLEKNNQLKNNNNKEEEEKKAEEEQTNFRNFMNAQNQDRRQMLHTDQQKDVFKQKSVDKEGFEEIHHSEAYFTKLQFDHKIEQNISAFDDIGMDSVYPLMTSDPEKGKEFTVKITNQKLDHVFDDKNKNNFNLQSIMIQDYIPQGKQNSQKNKNL